MHHLFDHVLAAIFTFVLPVRALLAFRRLQQSGPEQQLERRRSAYRVAMLMQWSLVVAVLALWFVQQRRWVALGLELRWTPGLMGVLFGLTLITILLLRQRAGVVQDDDTLQAVRKRMSRLEALLPHNPEEFRRFAGLGITAGIGEELFYRGFLIWYLSQWMDVLAAAVVSSLIFGVGHAYQGTKGIVQTTLLGAFLAAVYLVSGSIYPSMVIHALMDLHSGHLMMKAYQRRDEQNREAAAATLDEGPAPEPEGA